MRGAIRWLRANPPPEPARPAIVHGDYRVGNFLFTADGAISAVHDCADGGAAVAMAEMALAGNIGFTSHIAPNMPLLAGLYFGEDQGRYLVTTRDFAAIKAGANAVGLVAVPVGVTGGDACAFEWVEGGKRQSVSLAQLRAANEAFFKDWMD